MISCGVSLERLCINQPVVLTGSEPKDNGSDVSGPNASQKISEDNVTFNLQSKCGSVEKDGRKSQKKHGQHTHRPASSNCSDGGSNYDGTTSAAELRLTLKKVKMENGVREEEKCVYECHTKKSSTSSKKTPVKSDDRSRSTVNQTTSAAIKDIDGLTESGKVITLMLILFILFLRSPCVCGDERL